MGTSIYHRIPDCGFALSAWGASSARDFNRCVFEAKEWHAIGGNMMHSVLLSLKQLKEGTFICCIKKRCIGNNYTSSFGCLRETPILATFMQWRLLEERKIV